MARECNVDNGEVDLDGYGNYDFVSGAAIGMRRCVEKMPACVSGVMQL